LASGNLSKEVGVIGTLLLCPLLVVFEDAGMRLS
jgi:hypothetical protein